VFADYETSFRHVRLRREDGILELRLHTDGGPLVWGDGPHEELGRAFTTVGRDPENRVVIVTGTGSEFIASMDTSWAGAMTPQKWNRIFTHGQRLLTQLLDIEVPVISAINGPAKIHAELAVLGDIVVAEESAYLQDAPHFKFGTVPGDGVHVIWPLLLGPNRGRSFLLTGERIDAAQAKSLGIVAEVVPDGQSLAAAWKWARVLARQPDITLRYTRAALTHGLKQQLHAQLGYGLALEGLTAHETWPES
jgi:enoyl-CoA hydratase/carnithine racemase